jgi:ABC-2 type transport system ATP-binding protein
MLELKGISKKFSAFTVVKDVSFTVRPGEVLGYLGPNGAGKTTTIKMLAGLLEPTKGEILFEGRKIGSDLYA